MQINIAFWKNASPRRKRIYSTLFILLLSVAVTFAGTLVSLSPEDAKQISDSVNQTLIEGQANDNLALAIFLNNFPLCLLMFIPLIGCAIGLFILFSTGLAIRAVFDTQAASTVPSAVPNIDATTAILILVSVGLTFLLEYVSYAIGMTESIWLFRRLLQRRWRELKTAAMLIGLVALLLVMGAVVETWGISLGI